jgi:hypothetical protein
VAKTTNIKNGRAKMHAKLLSQMARQLIELRDAQNMLNLDMKNIWNMMV